MIGTAEPTYTLRTLRVASDALKGDTLPSRIKLLSWGANQTTQGLVSLGASSAALLPTLQKDYGYEEIALDFEHNTVPGSPEYERTREPRPVAAYGTLDVVPGDGLFLNVTRWPPAGKAEAANYADLSPALLNDPASGEVMFLHSVALTRNGSVDGLKLELNSATLRKKPMAETTSTAAPAANTLTVAELAPALGLDATADKAAVLGKLKILSAGPDLTAIVKRLDTIEAARTDDVAAREQRQRDDLVAQASREGKIIPLSAEAVKTVPVAALKEIVDKLPKGKVPTGSAPRTGSEGIKTFSAVVADFVKAGKNQFQAVQAAIAAEPDLYKEYRETGGAL